MDWDTKTYLYEDGDEVVTRSSLLHCRHFLDPCLTYYIEVHGMQHGRITDCASLFDMLGKNTVPPLNMTMHVDE
jgi:extradiol dioxygenase family protein